MQIANHAPKPCVWETRIQLPAYGQMEACPTRDGAIWRLQPRQPLMPPLLLVDYSQHASHNIMKHGDVVVITSAKGKTSTMDLALLLDDGLFRHIDYNDLYRMLRSDDATLRVANTPIEYRNRWHLPRVEVVRIENPHGGPYMVAEKNLKGEAFWLVRR